MGVESGDENGVRGDSLVWLADAPLFIDADQVESFYDAVVRPESEFGTITLSTRNLQVSQTHLAAGAGVELGISDWIKSLFPFLKAEIKVEAEATKDKERSEETAETVEIRPISTPQRQLVQLALHYAANLPRRMKVATDPNDNSWSDADFIGALPRALIFLDLQPGAIFIPTAAELPTGKVVTFFDELTKAFAQNGEKLPTYPMPQPGEAESDLKEQRDSYWVWFRDRYRARKASDIVEQVIGSGGRVRWIDYRIPIGDVTLHLHVCGREEFDTGVFAYNFVRRGHRHGLRLVGTLKSEPDMNVLAIFEK